MENLWINHFVSFDDFRKNHQVKSLKIKEDDLLIIYHLIDNNRFVLSNEHYLPVLLHSIKEKTSLTTSLKFKSLLNNIYPIFLNV